MVLHQRFLQTSILAVWALLQIQPSIHGGDDEPTITVTGAAELSELADQVVIESSIASIADSVEVAVEQNKEKVEKISKFLKKSGLDAKQFQMGVLSIGHAPRQRDYANNEMFQQQMSKAKAAQFDSSSDDPFSPDVPPREARQQPKVKVARDLIITLNSLTQFELIYEGLMKIDSFPSHSVRFQSSKIHELRDQVRRKAIMASKDKATSMAAALGATLSSVKTIVEKSSDSSYGRIYADPFGAFDDEESDSENVQNHLTIRATTTVSVVYVLGNTAIEK